MKDKQTVLIVLDGWGYRKDPQDNAIMTADTPFFDSLWSEYPHTLLDASGLAVGLPEGQMGNSEVGHTTIGAGTTINTDLVRINEAIESGKLGENETIQKLFTHVKEHHSTLHFQGLLSDGGVHSHQQHLFALLQEAKKAWVKNITLHLFTDGRDTSPTAGKEYLKKLEELGIGIIATISGRFYAMDRDTHWGRIEKAQQAIFDGIGNKTTDSPIQYLEKQYKAGTTDEYIEPVIFNESPVRENDALFFFNFRADRARQITSKILERIQEKNIYFATMTQYSHEFACDVAFPDVDIEHTLGSVISGSGLTQSHIAETEKFAHATYFLNGGREKPYEKETDVLLESRKDVETHDQAPKMRAESIADKAIEELDKGQDFIFINFANPDMVGHTGNVPAIIEAVEETDRQCRRVVEHLLRRGGIAFVTADHGNAEVNKDENGNPHTSHTTNPVPAIVTDKEISLREGGGLSDIAPTIFEIMNLQKPQNMKGESLLTK